MRSRNKIATLAICALALHSGFVRAATHTNLIYNVSIGFNVTQQDYIPLSTNQFVFVVRKSTFGTQNIAAALANSPLFRTNHLEGGKLLFRVTDLGTNRDASFILRKGTNDVDMRDYMSLSFASLSVTSKAPASTGATTNATDYTTLDVSLAGTPGGYFDAQGFCIVKNTSVLNGRTLIQAQEFPATIAANLAGTGATGGKTSFFKGTILISGRRVEIKDY